MFSSTKAISKTPGKAFQLGSYCGTMFFLQYFSDARLMPAPNGSRSFCLDALAKVLSRKHRDNQKTSYNCYACFFCTVAVCEVVNS